MRKGLWSPDEDERLVRCITKYVNGSWSDIARKAGLDRCGKSCRRRWMNHLRPDLKRGKFSMDEINLIVQLQEALGNRWSDIASHLEGRTDNDVKNLWNTQIKKRLSQLKAQNLSSSVPLTFGSITSTHAACSTNNNVDNINMGHLANMGLLLHRTVDEYENGGMQVLRFGGGGHGNGQDYIHSCSASSCEGSDQLPLNDQENSSWKPTINALTLPQADVKPHDYNSILWSSANMQGNIDQQMQNQYGAEDRSLLMRPCGSSSIQLMSSGISRFMQPSQIMPLDERAVASCAEALFDLHYPEGAQLAAPCANTIASWESSSSYVPLKTDNGVVADDNEECCSLQHNLRAVPPTLINRDPESQDQIMARNGVGSSNNLLSANAATINTSSFDEIAHRYINDHHQIPQQHTALQFSRSDVNVSVNIDENIYTSREKIGITTIHDSAVAGLAPAINVISADSDHNPSLWGEGQNQYPYQPPISNYVNMQGAGAAHGWDYVSECSNVMPHLSFADWCKQLVHDQY